MPKLLQFLQQILTSLVLFFSFQIRAKQEQLLKVRNFLPPQAQEPEIFLLEKLIEKQVENKVVNGDLFGDREGESIGH